jgi:arylsulfatase A-like enzyme
MRIITQIAGLLLIAIAVITTGCSQPQPKKENAPIGSDVLDRKVLPVKVPPRPTFTELDIRNVTQPKRVEVKAPEGAPNVILVLVDDLGFAGTSFFGGPVSTPTFDRLAGEGIYYNNFHTTAVCSPTRAAIKSGRNHHVNNMAFITEMATGMPGCTGEIPGEVAPIAEILRLNGYSTGAFGKWHETATWETSISGPFDRWPTRQGFDKFYGFLGGETNQWAPFIYDGTHVVELPEDPNYHFMNDMTNQAVAWMKFQKAMTPDKPYFMYFAPGATHAPHHVPQKYIDKWKGKFDGGWDAMREQILARQIEMGIVPEGTQLAPKPEAIQQWDKLSADEKKLFIRQAETFAGFLDMTDHEIGRLLDAVDETGQADNTLIIFVYGDNGTSSEGGMNGMFSEMTYFNGVQETVEDMLKKLDKWGGPETYPHMAAGWAVMFDTPYQWTKQVASDPGGTKVGMAIRWPKGIKANGGLRPQFSHVIDIAPTILEAAGLPEPKIVNGVAQVPMDGTSLVYSFNDAAAKEKHTTQYFEMAGNRAIYHDGWYARTIHRAPWEQKPRRTLQEDIWELYYTPEDFSLVNDLAAQNPEKLKELQDLFMREAGKNYALPIDDRVFERLNAAAVGRPTLLGDRTSLTLAEGMVGIPENAFLNVKNRSKTLTADIEIPGGITANGILIAQAGRFGGWALYIFNGTLAYDYNFLGLERYTVEASQKLTSGKHTVKFEFAYDGGGPGKGGLGTLYIDGKKVGEGRIEHTQPGIFSADETADVGIDLATPVVERIGSEAKSKFNGSIPKLVVEVK